MRRSTTRGLSFDPRATQALNERIANGGPLFPRAAEKPRGKAKKGRKGGRS